MRGGGGWHGRAALHVTRLNGKIKGDQRIRKVENVIIEQKSTQIIKEGQWSLGNYWGQPTFGESMGTKNSLHGMNGKRSSTRLKFA